MGAGTPGASEFLINTDGALDFHQPGMLNVPNDLTGAGTLVQSGTGRTILTGPSTRAGNTRVMAGIRPLTSAALPDAAALEISTTGDSKRFIRLRATRP